MTIVRAPDAARGETPRSQRWSQLTYWPLAIAAAVFLFTYTVHVIGEVDGVWAVVTSGTIALDLDAVHRRLSGEAASRRTRAGSGSARTSSTSSWPCSRRSRPVRLLDAFTRLTSFTKTAGSSIRARLLIYGVGSALLLVWYISLIVLQIRARSTRSDHHVLRTGGLVGLLHGHHRRVRRLRSGDGPRARGCRGADGGGVVVVGLVVATISSWVVERASRGHDDAVPASRADMRALTEELQTGRAPRGGRAPGDRPPHGGRTVSLFGRVRPDAPAPPAAPCPRCRRRCGC